MKPQRVAIVEIAPVIAEGIASILERAASVEVIGSYRAISDILPLITMGIWLVHEAQLEALSPQQCQELLK